MRAKGSKAQAIVMLFENKMIGERKQAVIKQGIDPARGSIPVSLQRKYLFKKRIKIIDTD